MLTDSAVAHNSEAGIAAQVHDNLRSSVANVRGVHCHGATRHNSAVALCGGVCVFVCLHLQRVRLRNLHQLHEHIITSVEEFHATAPALDYLAMV